MERRLLAIAFALLMVTSMVSGPALAGSPSSGAPAPATTAQPDLAPSPASTATAAGIQTDSDTDDALEPDPTAFGLLPTQRVAFSSQHLAGLDPDSGQDADRFDRASGLLNESLEDYAAQRATDRRPFDNYQEALHEISRAAGGDHDETLAAVADGVIRGANETARVKRQDANASRNRFADDLDETATSDVEVALSDADAALRRAEDALQRVEDANYTLGRSIRERADALDHYREANHHTDRALSRIEDETEPRLAVSRGQAVERNGTVVTSLHVTLVDVRPWRYDEITVEAPDAADDPASISLDRPYVPSTSVTGTTVIDLGPDADDVTVTLSADANHADRTAERTHELSVDPDEIVREDPDSDEFREADVVDDATDVAVRAGGEGLADDAIDVRDATPAALDQYHASPVVRITNATGFESATVTMPLADDVDPAANLSIYTWDPSTNASWTPVQTEIDEENGTATAHVDHFSYFAVFRVEPWEDLQTSTVQLEDQHLADEDSDGQQAVNLVDLAFVIDESGSMGGSRIDNAKLASKRFVGELYDDEQAAVVGYDDDATSYRSLTTDHDAVNASIDSLSAGGSTNTGDGLQTALDELEADGIDDREDMIVLLSDGATNTGPDPIEVANDAADAGVEINTVGVGSGIDEDELQSIADVTGGDFFHVEDSGDLPDTFGRVADERTGPALRDSTGDGIPDAVADANPVISELAPIEGQDAARIDIDRFEADSSGDGLLDNETITVDWRVQEREDASVLEATVADARHHPNRTDTSGDGLPDREQVEGWEILVVDDHDDARAMDQAMDEGLDDPEDLADFFRTRTVRANPMLNQTSADGLTDARERWLLTDPASRDTSGDGIHDGRADALRSEDPTVYTTTGPTSTDVELVEQGVEVTDDFHGVPTEFQYLFHYQYSLADPSGVVRAEFSQEGIDPDVTTFDGSRTVDADATVYSKAEALLQHLRGIDARVTTRDVHGNERSELFRVQQSLGARLAELGLPAEEAGQLSGFTHGAAELPDLALMIKRQPEQVAESMAQLMEDYATAKVCSGNIHTPVPQPGADRVSPTTDVCEELGIEPSSETEFWMTLAQQMAVGTHRQMDRDNPHDIEADGPLDKYSQCVDSYAFYVVSQGGTLADLEEESEYCAYAAGWYQGYAAWMIVEAVVGSKGTAKAVSTVGDIADAVGSAGSRATRAGLRATGPGEGSPTPRVKQHLAAEGFDTDALPANMRTSGKAVRADGGFRRVDADLDDLTEAQRGELAGHLGEYPDGAGLVNRLGGDVTRSLFRLDFDGADAAQVRRNVFQRYNQLDDPDVRDRFAARLDDPDTRHSWAQAVGDPGVRAFSTPQSVRRFLTADVDDVDMVQWRRNLLDEAEPGHQIDINDAPQVRYQDVGEYAENFRQIKRLNQRADDPVVENPKGLVDEAASNPDKGQILGQAGETKRTLQYAARRGGPVERVVVEASTPGGGTVDLHVVFRNADDRFIELKTVGGDLENGLKMKNRVVEGGMEDASLSGLDPASNDLVVEVRAQGRIADDLDPTTAGDSTPRESFKGLVRSQLDENEPDVGLPESADEFHAERVSVIGSDGTPVEGGEFRIQTVYDEVKDS